MILTCNNKEFGHINNSIKHLRSCKTSENMCCISSPTAYSDKVIKKLGWVYRVKSQGLIGK